MTPRVAMTKAAKSQTSTELTAHQPTPVAVETAVQVVAEAQAAHAVVAAVDAVAVQAAAVAVDAGPGVAAADRSNPVCKKE